MVKRKSRVEIIEETANFYNLTNRGYDDSIDQCVYKNGEDKKCAVGRCLNSETTPHNIFKFRGDAEDLESFCISQDIFLEDLFLEQYKGHKIEFWMDLQNFHDKHEYWNEDGLTEGGLVMKEQLLNDWSKD